MMPSHLRGGKRGQRRPSGCHDAQLCRAMSAIAAPRCWPDESGQPPRNAHARSRRCRRRRARGSTRSIRQLPLAGRRCGVNARSSSDICMKLNRRR
eukprot:361557-Chlamydomonas_euryale.AAC.6